MTIPVIGAALGINDLVTYRDWILEKQRDLELQSFHEASVLDGDWMSVYEQCRPHLEAYTGRLGIHGPFWGFGLASKDPAIREVVSRRIEQGLDVCEALRATQMVIHSPFTTWDYNNFDNNHNALEAVIENAHATIGRAVKRAENQGVTLVVENIEDIDPTHRRMLMQSFESSAIRLSIDTGHAQYAHCSNGAPPVDYYVKSAGEWLEHVHLQDADGYADRHWQIGEGTIRWHSVFRALSHLQVKPRLILELRDKAGIPASMQYLEREGLGQ